MENFRFLVSFWAFPTGPYGLWSPVLARPTTLRPSSLGAHEALVRSFVRDLFMVYLARFGSAPICVPLPVGPYGGIIVTTVHYGRLPVVGVSRDLFPLRTYSV